MAKSKNAFALRDFDAERILQRKFFLSKLGFVHEETSINGFAYKETDADTLDLNDARNVAHLGSAEMVERLANLQTIKSAVTDYKNLLDVHINRLERLSTCYAKNFMETAAPMWQEKYRRAQNLQQAYDDALSRLIDLERKIGQNEQAGEKAIDQQRRKEFAIRLQDARKKTGMRQSDLAKIVGVAPATIANYEQGRADPQIPLLIRLAQTLNISANKLLGFE